MEKPSAISKDAPLSGAEDAGVTLTARVARVVGDADFGRFALTSSQVPPFTAFVPVAALQEKLGVGEKVNAITQRYFAKPPEWPPKNWNWIDDAQVAVGLKKYPVRVEPSRESEAAVINDLLARWTDKGALPSLADFDLEDGRCRS